MPEDWDAEWDDEAAEPDRFCLLGGPAPCMDDICYGLGRCMHTDARYIYDPERPAAPLEQGGQSND